jgi:hypothetical protein
MNTTRAVNFLRAPFSRTRLSKFADTTVIADKVKKSLPFLPKTAFSGEVDVISVILSSVRF